MNGYGSYKIKNGAVYMGEWLKGKAVKKVFNLKDFGHNGFIFIFALLSFLDLHSILVSRIK
jgi:hypothetical protein